ncbi:MAG TPA: hypothetical protein VHH36_01120, partial [Candidatus Thermoplasmatota archaeon]|nr:hypothetical protein [Candidatus Thermoplasmatota archaeon]
MNRPTARARALALVLSALTLLPAFPPAEASHTDAIVPTIPTLPHASPGDTCVGLGVAPEILAELNQVVTGGGFRLGDRDVPVLCGLDGQQVAAYAELVRQADAILENFRNVTREAQRQADERLEYTLPGGNRDRCLLLQETADGQVPEQDRVACSLLAPQVTLLRDDLDGRRTGGFGPWTVVTERGEEPAIRLSSVETFNGTLGTYRFGDDAGYPRGVHQWLVSPEIDLSVIASQAEVVEAANAARAESYARLYGLCNAGSPLGRDVLPFPFFPDGEVPNPLSAVCGEDNVVPFLVPVNASDPLAIGSCDFDECAGGDLIVEAYKRAIDDAMADLPALHRAATLRYAYRTNMLDGVDGVRA